MSERENFKNKCFLPNWLEVNEGKAQHPLPEPEKVNDQALRLSKKEERLESKRRKDLNVLLKELEQIKQSIEQTAEKQHRLANLMSFYTGEFAQ